MNRMSCKTFRTIAICALMGGLVQAQVPGGPEELSFNLVARDKKGKPLQNLKPGDLKVFDNGHAVVLTRLELVSETTEPRVVTLLIDRMEATGTINAKQLAERVLKTMPKGAVEFAVFKIDGRLRLYQQATSNRELVRKAIRNLDKSKSMAGEAEDAVVLEAKTGNDAAGKRLSVVERQQANALVVALGESQRTGRVLRKQSPLVSLLALARAAQSQPGRKAILFFTGGLRMDLTERELMRTVIGTANRAGVSIYAIDANSLDSKELQSMNAGMQIQSMGLSGANSGGGGSGGGAVIPGDTSVGAGAVTDSAENSDRMEDGLGGEQNALVDLCASTAGRYLGNEDRKYQLARMYADLTSYYRASYQVPSMQYDGQFRRVRVKPMQTKVRVLASTGYLALPSTAPVGTRPFEAALQKVLSQPQLPSDIGFRAAVVQVGRMQTSNALVVEIPFRDFQASEDANTKLYSLHVSMLAQIKDEAGTVIESFSDDLPRRSSSDGKDRMRNDVASVTRHFDAAAGDYVLEVAIQDRISGKYSAKRQPFKVAKMPDGAYLSDVSLVRRTEAFHSEADPEEALEYQGNRVVPNISDVVTRDAGEVSFFFVVHPDPQSSAKPKLEMEIRKDGQAVGRGELALRESPDGKPIAYMAILKSAAFAGGSYQAAVTLNQDGKVFERVLSFGVDGMAGAAAVPLSKTRTTLIIAPAPAALTRPADEVVSSLLSAAKERATDYTDSLPNVMCTEVTDRSVDALGTGGFQHRDTITELIRYHDKIEQRLMLGVDNKGTDSDRSAFKGTITTGEFGGLLNSIFAPEAKATFAWKETDILGADSVQVFHYVVAKANSTLTVRADNGQYAKPGFHGSVYVDDSTRAIRRLTLDSDEMAEDFPTHSVTFTVDYDYIAIGEHEYLLPVTGSAKIAKGKRMVVLNEFEFKDYKRYSAESKLQFDK